jgi:hypothetical protein
MGWNKYNAKRIIVHGKSFPSKAEASHYGQLLLRLRAGEIMELECQPTVRLTDAGISYKPDFKYFENSLPVWCEVKGVITDRFRLIKKLWKFYGPGPLEIWIGGRLSETIIPKEKSS